MRSMNEETNEMLQNLKHGAAEYGLNALAVSETRLEGTGILDPGTDGNSSTTNVKGRKGNTEVLASYSPLLEQRHGRKQAVA